MQAIDQERLLIGTKCSENLWAIVLWANVLLPSNREQAGLQNDSDGTNATKNEDEPGLIQLSGLERC